MNRSARHFFHWKQNGPVSYTHLVKILDMLSFESHLGMGYEFTTENIQTYLNDVAGVRIVCAFIDDIYMLSLIHI